MREGEVTASAAVRCGAGRGGVGWGGRRLDELTDISVEQAVVAAAVLVAGVVLAIGLRPAIMRAFRGPDSAPGAALLVARFLQLLLVATATMYVLHTLGIEIAPLLGALGIGGIAVALAVQSVLTNAIASVLLQIRRPFRRGDQIVTNDLEGRVLEINFRTVRLLTFDGNDVLREAAGSVGGVSAQPRPEAWVYEFGESTINVAVHFWHGATNAERWRVRSAVAVEVKRALDARGIVIAFPQRVVHLAADE